MQLLKKLEALLCPKLDFIKLALTLPVTEAPHGGRTWAVNSPEYIKDVKLLLKHQF